MEQKERVRFIDYYDDGNCLWFCGLYTDGLYRYDKTTKKTFFVNTLPTVNEHEGYRAIIKVEEKLYIAPLFANNILVYHIKENKLIEISLEIAYYYKKRKESISAKFSNIYRSGKYLYFVPIQYKAIVRFDIGTNTLKYYSELVDQLKKYHSNRDLSWFGGSCKWNNKIYLCCKKCNDIMEFDMISQKSRRFVEIDYPEKGFGTICVTEKRMYFTTEKGDKILSFEKESKSKKVKELCKGIESHFSIYLLFQEMPIYIPCKGIPCIYKINEEDTFTLQELNIDESPFTICLQYKNNSAALSAKADSNKIWIYLANRDALCAFDCNGNLLEEYIFYLEEKEYKKHMESKAKRMKQISFIQNQVFDKESKEQIMQENNIGIELNTYLYYISSK